MNVTIRPEAAGEADAVRAVNDAAFGQPDEGLIVDAIRGTADWIDGGSIVAVVDGRPAGHLLLSRGRVEGPKGAAHPMFVIGPLAVLPALQRQGIGGRLMRAAIDYATDLDAPAIALLGHGAYYRRFGFVPARSLGLEAPQPWPDDAWLALRLPAWTAELRGIVRYPPAFGVD